MPDEYLDGLTDLSAPLAEALARQKDSLSLDGLTCLSDAAAEALAKHQGENLSLLGLTSLSDTAAEALAKHQGELSLKWTWLPESAEAILSVKARQDGMDTNS